MDRNRTAGWSSYIVWTETGLLVGRAILFEQKLACLSYIVWTETGLLVGRAILFGQKPDCLLVELYCLDRNRPDGWSSTIILERLSKVSLWRVSAIVIL